MGDPVSATLMATAGGGSALQAAAQVQQGNAAKAAADYNAQVAEQNASLTKQQAARDEELQRRAAKKQLGSMRASVGASGLQLEGSAMDALEESASQAEMDALTIRHGGQVKALAYENEARIQRFIGKNARTSGYLAAAGTLLSGAGQAASWMKRT